MSNRILCKAPTPNLPSNTIGQTRLTLLVPQKMGLGRQRDHTGRKRIYRSMLCEGILLIIFRKHSEDAHSAFASNQMFAELATLILRQYQERNFQLCSSSRISEKSFKEHCFPFMSDDVFISLFRFRQQEKLWVLHGMGCPTNKKPTTGKCYSATPLLSTCVVLRRLRRL